LTSLQVGFKTSSTGALTQTAGSEIDVVLAAGTTFSHYANSSAVSVGGSAVGYCNAPSGTTVPCFFYGGDSIAASTNVVVELDGVNNPSALGAYAVKVSTSSDTNQVTSPTYTVTAAQGVGSVTLTDTVTTAAGGLTSLQVGFKTSSTGALALSAGSEMDVMLAAGTTFANFSSSSSVSVGGTVVGYCNGPSGTTVACFFYGGGSIAASTNVVVELDGVNNPSALGAYAVKVSTSSDTVQVTSPTYTVTAPAALKTATVKLSSTAASANNVTYTVTLTTSPTGALAQTAGSGITFAFPSGTVVTGITTSSGIFDGGNPIGYCNMPASGLKVQCFLYGGETVPASHAIVVKLIGVKNPGTSTPLTLKVTTTSDAKAKSVVYCVAAAGTPCISKVAPGSGAVGAPVTIAGINLSAASSVAFNDTPAVIGTNTSTKITTTVPSGATTGTIAVTNGGGTATSPKQFTVT
jgi:hypothetical protein